MTGLSPKSFADKGRSDLTISLKDDTNMAKSLSLDKLVYIQTEMVPSETPFEADPYELKSMQNPYVTHQQ